MIQQYPKFYFDGHYHAMGGIKSDKEAIMVRMAHIPIEEKNRVCREYGRIYLAKGPDFQEVANLFLHNEAVKFRKSK